MVIVPIECAFHCLHKTKNGKKKGLKPFFPKNKILWQQGVTRHFGWEAWAVPGLTP